MLDLEILRMVWWVLLGVVLMGFVITDGFDMGVAILFPFVAKTDTEKQIILDSLRPFWEGNQVWIIFGAGAIFAAWPPVYAVAFSSFYFLFLLVLLFLGISRPVSFKYRNKIKHAYWTLCWDKLIFLGGFIPALIFGLLIGNVMQGIPFSFDATLRFNYHGSFLSSFNVFGLWCALTSVCMMMMHGAVYLAIKTETPIHERAIKAAQRISLLLLVFFLLGSFWIMYRVPGYEVTSLIKPSADSNPLSKTVEMHMGGWMHNYAVYPWAKIIPLMGIFGILGVFLTTSRASLRWAFLFSCLSIIGIIGTVGVSMFPFLIPSSSHLASSLLVWDASASALTLFYMLIASLIFLPLIIIYTYWVYYVFRGKVTAEKLIQDEFKIN